MKVNRTLYPTPILPNEIWKDIVGYENIYMISNFGRVWAYQRVIELPKQPWTTGGTFLAERNHNGYRICYLYNNCKREKKRIHRLVAEAFIPNKNSLPVVNHIDGNKSNNKVDNLEWATRSENMQHAFDTGLIKRKTTLQIKTPDKYGWVSGNKRLILDTQTGIFYEGYKEAMVAKSVTKATLYNCLANISKNTIGLIYV